MSNSINHIDIFLQPGDFYFGSQKTRIATLLGSCIAITLWHPKKLIGGMCHYMLPSPSLRAGPLPLNGKYAEDAMKMFFLEIKAAGTLPSEYQAKVFGGGSMFSKTSNTRTARLATVNALSHAHVKTSPAKIHSLRLTYYKIMALPLP